MKRKMLICMTAFLLSSFSYKTTAQDKPKDDEEVSSKTKENDDEDDNKKEDKKKTIEEVIEGHSKSEGLFTFYTDSLNGSIKMSIKKEQLNKDFLYFNQVSKGASDIGRTRGSYLNSTVIQFKRFYKNIEIIVPNTSYYFNPKSNLSKSADANIVNSIIYNTEILAENDSILLINVDNLFKSHSLGYSKPPKVSGLLAAFVYGAGSLDKNKTKITSIDNFPENSGLEVEYVYTKGTHNSLPPSGAISDFRSVSVSTYHHLLEASDTKDYQTRRDDPRVGYFTTKITDLTSKSATPYRDVIERWKLIKKNPNADISEPVEPITFWIENTTPENYKPWVKEGLLKWNLAFEKAGFKNAIVVKEQPDDATWSAEDIRYNVLRWIASSRPDYAGYGPHFSDPRTGQIIGADIMLEYAGGQSNKLFSELFEGVNGYEFLTENQQYEEDNLLEDKHRQCVHFNEMRENFLTGQAMIDINNHNSVEQKERLEKEWIINLVMHEVGHTLGLMHNMKSSQLYSPEQLADASFIKGKPLTGSVMDYAVINLPKDEANKDVHFFSSTLGPYDYWAIEYGYKPFKSEAEKENLLQQSNNPELIFGNDAEDVRRAGTSNIDPRIMVWDISNDAISYSTDRLEFLRKTIKELKKKYYVKGNSYNELTSAFNILMGQDFRATEVISRYIGGIYEDRSSIGQEGAKPPFEVVPYDEQKRAVNALMRYVFSPNAYAFTNSLNNYLTRQRRGYSGPQRTDVNRMILRNQIGVLRHLLSTNTMLKVDELKNYGENTYNLGEYLSDLSKGVFAQSFKSNNISDYTKNMQVYYVKQILDRVNKNLPGTIKSKLYKHLTDIYRLTKSKKGTEADKAHKIYLRKIIGKSLK